MTYLILCCVIYVITFGFLSGAALDCCSRKTLTKKERNIVIFISIIPVVNTLALMLVFLSHLYFSNRKDSHVRKRK